MMIHIDNAGAIGIIKDLPAHELDSNAWSSGVNMRFYDGVAEKLKGYESAFSTTDTPTIAIRPYWLHPVQSGASYFWLYADTSAVHGTDGTTKKSLTESASFSNSISATVSSWSGGVIGEIAVLTNGQNEPYQWGSVAIAPDLGLPLIHLQNWPSATTCRILKPYKEFLIAMDVTESSTRNRRLVRWSHPAVPGTVPSSWDYTDRSVLAGRVELAGDQYPIVDGGQMRDTFMIYKDHSTWTMDYIGLPDVMSFHKAFGEIGILGKGCFTEILGRHVLFGDGDIVRHDGQTMETILKNRMRRWLYNDIDTTYFYRSFVTQNIGRSEVWFCYVSTGTTNAGGADYILPNKALVWNWRDDTTSIIDLPGSACAATGIVSSGSGSSTFDASSGTFDSDSSQFDEILYQLQQHKTLMGYPTTGTSRILIMDSTETTLGGGAMTSQLVRYAIPLDHVSDGGQRKNDLSTIKHLKAVYPRITGTAGTVVYVYLHTQSIADGTVTNYGPKEFTIGTTRKINTRVKGRLIGITFAGYDNNWQLTGYSLDVDIEGRR